MFRWKTCQFGYQAGLFSAVTSAFIIQVDSRLQPDPGTETAALLRILIYKIDNTTFGNVVPALPQWTGPPPTMVHVQAILFASLAASLLSAFLAMLGKQWLNRYVSTDMRGSAFERSQNRQRKLDGIVAWYFDHVMESLPLMLQIALLLLGCALSRYLWEIHITIASVVLGVTSSVLLIYFFILAAGTASESCPYQTPGSTFFRYLGPKVRRVAVSTLRNPLGESEVTVTITENARHHHPWWSGGNTAPFFKDLLREIPSALITDARNLGRAVIQAAYTVLTAAYRPVRGVLSRLGGAPLTPEQELDHQTTALNLRCVSWTLQTSLEKPIHLSALKYLITITEFPSLDPTLIMDCFYIFVGCISVGDGKVVIIQGLERLATASARCFLHSFHHLSSTHPTSSTLADLHRRYDRIFPLWTDFRGLPFYTTMADLHALVNQTWNPRLVQWYNYRPSNQELIPFARHMVEATQEEYQRTQKKRVPCWILRFALHFLSLDPPSPASVTADCLTIVAITLDHEPPSASTSDERYICSVLWVPAILIKVQFSGAGLKPHYPGT